MRPLGFLFFIFCRADFGDWRQNTRWKTSSAFNKTSEHTFAGCRCQQMKTWDLIIVFLAGRLCASFPYFFLPTSTEALFLSPAHRSGSSRHRPPPAATLQLGFLCTVSSRTASSHISQRGFYFPVGAAGMVEAEGARWNLTWLNVSI